MRMKMLLTAAAGLAALLAPAGLDPAAAQSRKTLDIYVVDVEGGNATLFVSPSGESLLIDTATPAPCRPCATPDASSKRRKPPACRRSIT